MRERPERGMLSLIKGPAERQVISFALSGLGVGGDTSTGGLHLRPTYFCPFGTFQFVMPDLIRHPDACAGQCVVQSRAQTDRLDGRLKPGVTFIIFCENLCNLWT